MTDLVDCGTSVAGEQNPSTEGGKSLLEGRVLAGCFCNNKLRNVADPSQLGILSPP